MMTDGVALDQSSFTDYSGLMGSYMPHTTWVVEPALHEAEIAHEVMGPHTLPKTTVGKIQPMHNIIDTRRTCLSSSLLDVG